MLRARHADEKKYERRAVLLDGLARLAPLLSAEAIDELLGLALTMATDRVPNLRLLLADSLPRVAEYMHADQVRESILPVLQELEADDDVDVAEAARDGRERCLSSLLMEAPAWSGVR